VNTRNDPISLRFPVAQLVYYDGSYLDDFAFDSPSYDNPFAGGQGWGPSQVGDSVMENYDICFATFNWLAYNRDYFSKFKRSLIVGKHEYVIQSSLVALKEWIVAGGKVFLQGFEFGWEVLDDIDEYTVQYPVRGGEPNFPAYSVYYPDIVKLAREANFEIYPDWTGYYNIGQSKLNPNITMTNLQPDNIFGKKLPDKWYLNVNYLLVGYVEKISGKWCIIESTIDCDNVTIIAASEKSHPVDSGTLMVTSNWRYFYGILKLGKGEIGLFGGNSKSQMTPIEWLDSSFGE
jgi:hypothetical protein